MKVFLNEVSGAMEKHVKGRGGYLKHVGNRVRAEPPEKNTKSKARKGVTSPPRVLCLGRGDGSAS